MANIGIITYSYRHLKTEQVMNRLLAGDLGNDKYTLFALRFTLRSPRREFFCHRPNQFTGLETSELASKYGLPFIECESDIDIPSGCDLYIITGSGIISESCVQGKRILNCHSGIIPLTRGLDSFKWAIIEHKPVGNTLHYIDKNIDEGDIIAVKQTPLYSDDTLSTYAARHYSEEIEMLANYKYYLQHPKNDFIKVERCEPHRRMPIDLEVKLEDEFELYKRQYSVKKQNE